MTLREARDLLSSAGVTDPLFDARKIFAHFGGYKSYELVDPNLRSSDPKIEDAVLRRSRREPLQYIIGEADFYRECYTVSPDCLIPRGDTEILVDYAVKNLPRGATFLDLCCGSGCIAISTLNNTDSTNAVAVDLSEGALKLAKLNAERIGVSQRIEFLSKDVTKEALEGDFFAVLSNPPYVTERAYGELEPEIYCEPRIAFVGGEDGGDFYRTITALYRDLIPNDGFIAYEIGYDQAELIARVADENRMKVEIFDDLSGNPRLAVLKKI